MNINKAPCMGCEDRHVGCHVGCEKFKSWSESKNKVLQEAFKKKKADNYVAESTVNKYSRFFRGTGKNIKIKNI